MKSILTITTILVPLIVYPYVSRVIRPSGIGSVNFATSVIYYFIMFAQLGIPTYGIRACAKVRDNKDELTKTTQEILIISIITMLISYIVFYVCVNSIPLLKSEKPLLIAMSLQVFFTIIGIEWFYSGLEQYDRLALPSVIFKFLMLFGCFLFVKSENDYPIYGLLYVIGMSGNGIVNFLGLKSFISLCKLKHYDFKRHLKPIFTFFMVSIAVSIYTQMDALMLGFMRGTTENGYYDAAVKIKLLLVNLIFSLGSVLMPRGSYYLEKGQKEEFSKISEKALNFVIDVAPSLCVFFMLFAAPSIMLLSGKEFTNSIIPMVIIMPSLVFIGVTNITGLQILVPMGKEKSVLISTIIGAVVNLVINAILIPKYGASGAAIGTVVAELAVLISQFISLKGIINHMLKKIEWHKIVLSTILAILSSYWVIKLGLSSIITLLIGAICYFAIYALTLFICKEQLFCDLINSVVHKNS